MNNIIVYTTNPPCPKCRVLEKKLNEANITYNIINDVNTIKADGYGDYFMPLLKTDNQVLEFADAILWVNNIIQGDNK